MGKNVIPFIPVITVYLEKLIVVVQPAPPLSVKGLAVQQDLLILRVSSLMTSLFELKSRLALMDDPQVFFFYEALFWLFFGPKP